MVLFSVGGSVLEPEVKEEEPTQEEIQDFADDIRQDIDQEVNLEGDLAEVHHDQEQDLEEEPHFEADIPEETTEELILEEQEHIQEDLREGETQEEPIEEQIPHINPEDTKEHISEDTQRRGSEIDDDLLDDIECSNSLPTTEQLELGQPSEEVDLLKESDSWDDLQGKIC